jgi:hypothetical protein
VRGIASGFEAEQQRFLFLWREPAEQEVPRVARRIRQIKLRRQPPPRCG